jgi:hypothetical protein
MRIGITGTKTYENRIKIKNVMHELKKRGIDITVVGLGEKDGADKYIKRFALEFGYQYREANPPHTPQNLYSLLSEQHYNKPYSPRNYFMRNKIYAQYVDSCVVFDDTNLSDTKIAAIVNAMGKAKKKIILIS